MKSYQISYKTKKQDIRFTGLTESKGGSIFYMFNNVPKCWICNSPADSREHKIKKADIIRVYGKGSSFHKKDLHYCRHDGQIVSLRGPDSKDIKFDRVICRKCNNERTQPFDRAYDAFIEHIESNRDLILRHRQIDFQNVYGNNWENLQLNLFRYFAKMLGCRIADFGEKVPMDLKNLLFSVPFKTMLWVCMAVNEDELKMPLADQTMLWTGNLITNKPRITYPKYAASCSYKWLFISFWYGWGPFGSVGSQWCADSQYLYLGTYTKASDKIILSNGSEWPGFL